MHHFVCQIHHPDDTLIVLPTMGFMHFARQPEMGYHIKSCPHFNLTSLFHMHPDGSHTNGAPFASGFRIAPSPFPDDGIWLSVTWDTYAPQPYYLAQHLWQPFIDGIRRMQRWLRRVVSRRRRVPLSAFVVFARARLNSDITGKIIEATLNM